MNEELKKRASRIVALDLDWAKAVTPDYEAGDEFALLVGLHKARYELKIAPDKLRHESRAWLQDHGMSRLFGIPWPDDPKELP